MEVFIVKYKINLSCPKTEFGIYQLQAPGNPGMCMCVRMCVCAYVYVLV